MRRLAFLLVLAALPASAKDTPLVIYLENQASRMLVEVVIFPVADTGEVIDDVLMARHEPIAGNSTVALDTRLTRCGPIRVWARFADGEEVAATTDLCRNNRLIVTD
ncbi:hypothetical protein [Neotabrizicola shimadae]|uniref:UrcA family protein n=1 Tax=Neotabrizicola shimadae TaxID=2807096 RepID=A0A8G0ZYD7_9RHOB|nr:hypothetical protein [Neotabrizicola shimadae]QYZ71362.1 hypothetical protein JO391_07635 [Neotabrizicola shimadae]